MTVTFLTRKDRSSLFLFCVWFYFHTPHSTFSWPAMLVASNGYPGSYVKGIKIKNVEKAEVAAHCVKIFHVGTTVDEDGNYVVTGGRVLGVTAKGKDIKEARDGAYRVAEEIKWEGGFYRKDIGWRAIPMKQKASK